MNASLPHSGSCATPPRSGVEVVRQPEELAADVRAFLQQAEMRCAEFGLAWFSNMVATVYPGSRDLRFYVLRQEGKVLAVLPLRAQRGALGWTLHGLANFYTTLFEPLLAPDCGAADLALLLSTMRADLPGLASLRLAPMDPSAPAYRLVLEGMRAAGWRPFEFFAFGNWYQPVNGSWTEYLAKRNGTLRNTIKRMTKKFGGDGGKLEIVSESADLARAIDAYEKVYASSWKKPEPYREFMPGLARTCAERGYLRLGLAWLNGRPIAAQLWIVSHGRAEIYKVAYDEGFKAYAPGTLLTALLMEHVIEIDKVAEVDYLIGDDPYKKTWMSHRRERWGVIAYNPRSLSGLAGWGREALGRRFKSIRARLATGAARTT
jgi:CelD/BcsL family acetyltransferase involved in cellulose biosynthesis